MNNMWQELQKRGYQITLERVADRSYWYSKPEQKRKDLIQELALVVDWVLNKFNIHILVSYNHVSKTYYWWLIEHDANSENLEYKTPQEAIIAAIKYLIENKII